MIEFHGRQYLELLEVCRLWGKDKDYVLSRMANEALLWYRGDAYPYDWETRDSECSAKFVEGYFWIHDTEVYASLRFLTGSNPDLATLTVSRMIPHYVAIGGKMIHGTHRYDPAGDDYLPVDDDYQPTSITLRQGCSVYFWKDRVERMAEETHILGGIDESSLPRDAVVTLEKQKKESAARWLKKPLWSEAELRDFCCGMFPDLTRSNTAELNDAGEIIMRAVMARDLPLHNPPDATSADRMYGHSRFFRPADAIRWAASTGLFPEFPFTVESLPAETVKPEPTMQSHFTQDLQLLIQASNYFWKDADPADKESMAKKSNSAVAKWLVERGFSSETLASKGASIIRPTWAATGRPAEG